MGQLSLRVKYLVDRALHVRGSNVVEFAKQTKRVSKAPLPIIMADMLWCSVRYEMGFRDYAVWDIRTLKAAERRTWMTHPKAYRLSATLNGPESRQAMEDKKQFLTDFADVTGREWIDAAAASEDELTAFLQRNPSVIAKPADGFGGAGIAKFDATDIPDVATWRAQLIADKQTLVEAVLVQHPELARLYPRSVNTIRLITYLDKAGTFHVIAAVLRMGNGGVIDNFAGGGMFTMLDEDGVAMYGAVDKNSNAFLEHPATKVPIKGFRVPMYRESVELVEKLSHRLPHTPYVGWDVAITPDGPAIIEANHNSSVFQMKPSVSGVRTGLLADYEKAVGFSLKK
ncbi:sugar-transfer associated ATP-grasp domain-containing protein [Microbacterium gorillae]|uniref:sugar-transfer associated ATP-grasp domain-containing protein n=1 Tax=Microbacterium gorillae TaxID=1231063 RepID=UPI0005913594|nr:sugar-transfer associated ATP-grasp domain-containing protein [Microbacterium gorillae]